MLTKEQYKRVEAELAETRRLIAKEMRYSQNVRKHQYLGSLRQHEAKLIAMMLK